MTPLPEDICYKASPAENYDGNARLVVRVADYRTAYNKIVHLEKQVTELRACVRELLTWDGYEIPRKIVIKAKALIGEGGKEGK